MGLIGNQGKKNGNNILFYLAGGLTLFLVLLIFMGSGKPSSIDQLLSAAAPDSSGYIPDATQNELIPGDQAEEEPEEVVTVPVPVKKDTAVSVATTSPDTTIPTPPTATVTETNVEAGGEKVVLYKIKRGDTMFKIAAKFGNKPADILALNGLPDMSVQADKEIKVKVKAIHAVSDGEGLNAVAEKFGVPAKSIKAANGLVSDNIPYGSTLIIPLK
jgi:LysM repeat protein